MNYPVLLNLQHQPVVIVGGGQVAARKILDVLEAGAVVTVISPTLHESLSPASFEWRAQRYETGMIAALRPFVVIAATDSADVNAQAAEEGLSVGALVNTVDHSAQNSFTTMAAVHRGSVTLAAATGGASPALTAHLRKRLEETFGDEYATFARWLGEARPLVRERVPEDQRRALWTSIIESPVLDVLRSGDAKTAREIFEGMLP